MVNIELFLNLCVEVVILNFLADFPSEFSSSSVGSRTTVPDKCRVASCAKLAAPERHGHCQECFTIFYPDMVYREAVVERQISELSVGSIND